ncbi:MAG: DsbA family protein [Anaerolineales bacterium]
MMKENEYDHEDQLNEVDSLEAESEHSEAADRDEGYLRFRRSHLYAVMLPLAFAAGLAAGFLAWGKDEPAANAGPVANANPAPVQETRMQVETDDDPAIGPADAPITIVEFSDYNCPYCTKFHEETFQALLDAYPNQIRFVYRDFPITSQESFRAAQAAECAGEQDAYWEFHDALFSGSAGLGLDAYQQYAQEIGLDADSLLTCIEEERFASEVEADARYAAELGVTGTPTFFINGVPLVGAQPLSRFTQIIDNELN